MATINKHGKGHRVYFKLNDKRKGIYLTNIKSKRNQITITALVSELENCFNLGLPHNEQLLLRLETIRGSKLESKLVAVGLLKEALTATLGDFIDALVSKRKHDLEKSTLDKWYIIRRSLIGFFGEDKQIASITVGNAEDFKFALQAEGLAEATVAKRLRISRQWFGNAVKHELIRKNPFRDIVTGSEANDARRHYVTANIVDTIINTTPCREWKVIISLWRFGGLRKDEVLHLTWNDILWEEKKIRVTSPKTRRHGKGERIIPLWPHIETHLEELFHQAKIGTTRIITKYVPGQNLYTEFMRLVTRAGIEKWPRLIQNLRSSCQNDLERSGHRPTVVAAWIGNSVATASKHYLGVDESDFEKAKLTPSFGESVQNSVQHQAVGGRNALLPTKQGQQKPLKNKPVRRSATACNLGQMASVPPLGLEPRTL
jgi:integrase